MGATADLTLSEAKQYARDYPVTVLTHDSGAVTISVPKDGLYGIAVYTPAPQGYGTASVGGVACNAGYAWIRFHLKGGVRYKMDLYWSYPATLNGVKGVNIMKQSIQSGEMSNQ